MAGKKPGFVTGANARITVGGKTIAYATNVGYDVSVQNIPIEGIGRYEPWTHEPVSYACSGSLAIIRYTKAGAAACEGNGMNANGNTLDGLDSGTSDPSVLSTHFDPSQMLMSQSFDITIYAKSSVPGSEEVAVFQVKDCRFTRRTGNLDKRGLLMDQFSFVGILAGDFGQTGASTTNNTLVNTDLGV